MIKFLGRDSLTFDVETIPDVEAGRRLYRGPVASDGGTDDGIRQVMWRESTGYDSEKNPQPFLKPILQQVVSIAWVRRLVDPSGVKIQLGVSETGPELSMIEGFLKGLGRYHPQLVGYNSEGFDLPLLVQRALVHRLSVKSFCARPTKPWEGVDYFARYSDHHIDLQMELAGVRAGGPKLSEVCAAMNILGGAKDVSGADVLDLWVAGELAEIRRYNAKDAVRQFLVLLRLCLLAGHITADEAAREEADVCQQLDVFCSAEVSA